MYSFVCSCVPVCVRVCVRECLLLLLQQQGFAFSRFDRSHNLSSPPLEFPSTPFPQCLQEGLSVGRCKQAYLLVLPESAVSLNQVHLQMKTSPFSSQSSSRFRLFMFLQLMVYLPKRDFYDHGTHVDRIGELTSMMP